MVGHQGSPSLYKDLLNSIKGVAFLGVPHRGSGIARLGLFLAQAVSMSTAGTTTNKELVKILKQDSKWLANLSKEANHRLANLHIYSFYETERTTGQVVSSTIDPRFQCASIDIDRSLPRTRHA